MSPIPSFFCPRLPGMMAIGLILLYGTNLAQAQGSGGSVEGRRIAARSCSGCHQIDVRTRDSTNDPIPSFQAIAALPSMTTLALSVFLRTSHKTMPNIQLTETEISDVGAYILSLRGEFPK
jgi:mono/diheme cytochrome c family protein